MWQIARVSFPFVIALALSPPGAIGGDVSRHQDGKGKSFTLEGSRYDIRDDGTSSFRFRLGNGLTYRIYSSGERVLTHSTPSFHVDWFSNGGVPGRKYTPRKYGLSRLPGSVFRQPLKGDLESLMRPHKNASRSRPKTGGPSNISPYPTVPKPLRLPGSKISPPPRPNYSPYATPRAPLRLSTSRTTPPIDFSPHSTTPGSFRQPSIPRLMDFRGLPPIR